MIMEKITIKVPEISKVSLGTTETSKLRKDVNAHVADKSNPHNVTAEQLGLENVDNTSDMNKPISTKTQEALNAKADNSTFETHSTDIGIHIQDGERENWNNKYTTEEVNDLCDQVRQQMREETSWHTNDKSNPHNVTAEQLGAEVTTNKSTVIDNTADDTKYPTTKAVADYVDEKDIYVETKTVYLGDDVLGSASLGEGWSEADSVYTHAKGYTADLTFETEVEENSIYILEFDTSYTANEYIRVGIGDRYRILCYKGSATHVTVPLMASGGTILYFTPYNDAYAGSISNITLRKIQENGEKRELEIYSTATDNHTQNYGFWNTFIGHDTAENAVGTTRSIAIGAYTLRDLQGGHRNIGIGTFAMSQLIGGEENISIGADSMLAVKNAEACVAMGMAAMYEGASRKEDIAIGKNALRGVSTSETEKNIAIGSNAGYKVTTAKDNVLIGNNAGYNMETGNNNVFVGPLAGKNADSYGCVAIGSQADTEGFSQSTVIGYLAKATKSKQVVLGNDNTVETLLKGDVIVRGTDGVQRTIELSTNKSTTIDNTADDIKYPTTKAVKDYVDTGFEINTITETAEGSSVNITDSANAKLRGLHIYGKTTQADTPSVENPQELVSVGDSGGIATEICGGNIFDASALEPRVNSLGIYEDSYKITAVGGTKSGYTSSSYYLTDILQGMKGKTVVFSADKFTSEQSCSANAQIRIEVDGVKSYHVINATKLTTTITIPEAFTYVQLEIYTNGTGTALTTDNTVVIEGLRLTLNEDAPWEKFKEPQTLTLNTPNGLPGVPVTSGGNYTDENGQQYVCDEIDLARDKYVQRVAIDEVNITTISTSLQYTVDGKTLGVMYFSDKIKKSNAGALCSKARHIVNNNKEIRVLGTFYENETLMAFIGEVGDTLEIIKQKYDGSKLMYILAEPIERDLTDEEIAQYKALTTHKPVTNVFNDAGAHMSVDYVADPKTYIDNKFAKVENAILSLGGNV